MFDWNDARYFLAVAETGSTLSAGRALRVSQTTVARRIQALEAALGLVGRRIGDDLWTVYCSRGYAETHGVPRSRRQLAGHPLISGGGGEIGRYYGAWLRENGLESAIAMHHGTVTGLLSAVRSGLGLAALPCLVAEMDEELVRCLPVAVSDSREIWLLTHERLRHTPRIRTVMEFLGERLKNHARIVGERLERPDDRAPGLQTQ